MGKKKEIKKESCKNCNRTFRREFTNKGFICSGIVAEPFRDCDIIRVCQKYDDGKEFMQDMAYDEALDMMMAYMTAVNTWTRFTYQRPCGECKQKEEGCGPAAFNFNKNP